MTRPQGVAVLGGTFDPIHNGHIGSAIAVRDHLNLAQVRLIPSFAPPHRESPEASAEQRLEMAQLAVADVLGVLADDREIRRGGKSYTVDTLRSLRDELGYDTSICFVLGMDAYCTLDKWYQWQQIGELAHVVVLHRPGHARPSVPEEIETWSRARQAKGTAWANSSAAGQVAIVELEQIAVSATDIRRAFRRGELPCGKLPGSVIQYISRHGLYQSGRRGVA
jgi:nicotinate-nucleotide adenylyltransferase